MAGRFLFGSEAVTMRRSEAPKGPARKRFVSSWPGSNENSSLVRGRGFFDAGV
jgi:hypothetical protein